MTSPRYVQHFSGRGERWELNAAWVYNNEQHNSCWGVHTKERGTLFLPKSEYVLCEPEVQWEDVTYNVFWSEDDKCLLHDSGLRMMCTPANGYRLRKIYLSGERTCAFVVEKART